MTSLTVVAKPVLFTGQLKDLEKMYAVNTCLERYFAIGFKSRSNCNELGKLVRAKCF